jgi:predicted nucleic acid-binding protein
MVRRRRSPRPSKEVFFADTAFWIALVVKRDQFHARAVRWKQWLDQRRASLLTTEAVLWEWLSACAAPPVRTQTAEGYRLFHEGKAPEVIPFDPRLMQAAFSLYEAHEDKSWSLTDCLSFVVMQARGLTDALTADHHFEQAGFRALLLQDPPA